MPPLPLEDGEVEVFRTRFGSIVGWLWFVPAALTGLALVPVAFAELTGGGTGLTIGGAIAWAAGSAIFGWWPILSSGRVWLTTERLIFKPFFRAPRALPLAQARVTRARPLLRTLRVEASGEVLTMRFLFRADQTWGAIHLFSAIPLMHGDAGPALRSWKASRRRGMSMSYGHLVVDGTDAYFLPRRPALGVGAMLGQAALGLVGVSTISIEPVFPIERLIALLLARSGADRRAALCAAATATGGLSFSSTECTIKSARALLRRARTNLEIRHGDDVLIATIPDSDARELEGDWPVSAEPPN